MSELREPRPAMLVISMFSAEKTLISKGERLLRSFFGSLHFESEIMPFDNTAYYQKEFGEKLIRKFIAFQQLVACDTLWKIKLICHGIEQMFLADDKRTLNIDPGILTLEKLVLATGKNFSHRIYLGKGVFGDLTLMYDKKKGFITLPWTYPDYATDTSLTIFNRLRADYMKKIDVKTPLKPVSITSDCNNMEK